MRNWDLTRGYKIYFNLHKKCYSIQAWDLDKGGWRLYQHAFAVHVKDAKMQVNEKGRLRVIKEKRKNVHAFVVAPFAEKISKKKGNGPNIRMKDVCKYNPYKYKSFVDHGTGEPIYKLDEAVLRYGLVFYEKNRTLSSVG